MTGTELVSLLRTQIIEPNPAFFTSDALLRLINAAQKDFVRRTRVCQNFATTSTVQGQADYPMPADWLGAEKAFYNNVVGTTSNWMPLQPTSLEKLSQEYPNFLSTDSSSQGTPMFYYVIAQTMYIYPRPQTNGTNDIYMFYEAKPVVMTALTDALSIDDSLSDALEAFVMGRMYRMDGEPDLAKEQEERYREQVGEGRKWKKKRMLDGKWKIDIESFIPFSYGGMSNVVNQVNPLNQ